MTAAPAKAKLASVAAHSASPRPEIEGNPLSAEDIAVFEMFEREAWPHDRCRAHILESAVELAAE